MTLCTIEGCEKPHEAKGFCRVHYYRLRRHGDPLAGGTQKGETMRFIQEVAVPYSGKDCLTWPFYTNPDGYGMLKTGVGELRGAHRYVCEIVHGPPPEPKLDAAHTCGNGHLGCVNPNHLEWKTRRSNKADELIHGTRNRGERNGRSKITEEKAKIILALKGKETQQELGRRFGISRSGVAEIHRGRNWSFVRKVGA